MQARGKGFSLDPSKEKAAEFDEGGEHVLERCPGLRIRSRVELSPRSQAPAGPWFGRGRKGDISSGAIPRDETRGHCEGRADSVWA